MRKLGLFTFLLLLPALVALGAGPSLPSWAETLMHWETSNSYKPETEVNEKFRPENQNVFPVKSMDVPVDEIHVVDSLKGDPTLRQQVLIEKNGRKYFRFFIHPESEHLYKPLMKRYGADELYLGRATASTRGLFAWPKDPKDGNPVFLKLSLAKLQDGLGRIIPGWEVRRSVGISELASQTPSETWMKSGASIIPEVMGAYVDEKDALGFYVDEKQGKVFEHGLIIRDASFLQEAEKKGWEARPLFSLFTPDGDKPPVIIQKWKESGKEFVPFVEDYLFKPFLEKNRHLLFREHIIPEIHGQNVVVAVDPKTKEIKHFYHRDVGSMKVDMRMRWIEGKDVAPLRTPNAAYDFKFQRATSAVDDVFEHYLNDWLFRWTYQDEIRKYVPGFDSKQTLRSLQRLLREEAAKLYPLKAGEKAGMTVNDRLEKYIRENPPALKPLPEQPDAAKLAAFLKKQQKKDQYMELPESWTKKWGLQPGDTALTSQGVVKVNPDGRGRIYFHNTRDLSDLLPASAARVAADTAKRALRVGFFSGTFDPPHEGHKKLLTDAMKQFDLDRIYLLPNVAPDHKPNATPFELRRQMAEAFFAGDPRIEIADKELVKIADTRGIGGLQRHLAETHAGDQIFQIMGADSLERALANPEIRFPKNFTVVVGDRSGTDFRFPEKTKEGNPILALEGQDSTGFSSTAVRKSIAEGEKPAAVSDEVYEIIRKNGLYGAPKAKAGIRDTCRAAFGWLLKH